MSALKQLIQRVLKLLGYSIISISSISKMEKFDRKGRLLQILGSSPIIKDISLKEALRISELSKSQLGQDILAVASKPLGEKGFFVEFGATNGIDLSNTWILEKHFGWTGIVCEPSKEWHPSLTANRSCAKDFRCVYPGEPKLVNFSQTTLGELSTVSKFRKLDGNSVLRKIKAEYQVETVSLEGLLERHHAPNYIDFLSIDTEGSEYEILQDFNFKDYSFGLICVEHNYTKNREKLFSLLSSKGYRRIHVELSEFDDWYVPNN
jgi:FkbM family methyltransferase